MSAFDTTDAALLRDIAAILRRGRIADMEAVMSKQ